MPITVKNNCLVVLGPTASGKTRLAVELAARLNGEIISADSRQVYKCLDIGTGKDLWMYDFHGKSVPYHLINVAEPQEQFYLHDFVNALHIAFEEIIIKGRLPVVCGGTGLYLDALRKDFSYTQIPEDHHLRDHLQRLEKEELITMLRKLPSEFVEKVDKNSKKRLIRAIEIGEFLSLHPLRQKQLAEINGYYIGIDPGREKIEERLTGRLDDRLRNGMIEEAERLLQNGVSHDRLQRLGLEYKFLSAYLLGKISRDELREGLRIGIRQFAKRQMTWFRKMEKEGVNIHWLKEPVVTDELMGQIRASVTAPDPG